MSDPFLFPALPALHPIRRPGLRAVALLFCSAFCATAWAGPDSFAAGIEDFLYRELAHLGAEMFIELQPPAPQAMPCAQPQPFLPANAQPQKGRFTLGVRCSDGDNQKTLYMPVTVRLMGHYLVTSRDLAVGETIDTTAFELAHGELTALNTAPLRDEAEALGLVTRQRIAAGTPLQPRHVQRPQLVRRGDNVVIETRGRGFKVSREGQALEAGALGEDIAVKLDQRNSLKARVSGKGRVVAVP